MVCTMSQSTQIYPPYSAAFCAIACLRTAIAAFDRIVVLGDEERTSRAFNEVVYWVDEFYARRERARRARDVQSREGQGHSSCSIGGHNNE